MEQDIILKTDRAGRVRTPRERQERIVAEWRRSGVSATRFAEAIGMKYQTLVGWIRRHGGRRENAAAGEAPRWLEMAVAPRPAAGGGVLRVELPGGAVVVVGDATQLPMVVELLRALP